jgi:hypothetical protein
MNPNSIQEDVVCTKFVFFLLPVVRLYYNSGAYSGFRCLSPQASRGLRSKGSTTVVLDKIVDSTPSTAYSLIGLLDCHTVRT